MRPQPISNISRYDFTDPYQFIKGSFDISKIPVKYYMFSIPLAKVVSDLSLVSEINVVSKELWDVNNVFQREIDEERVGSEIVKGYLENFEKIKFFNPITVAFIPRREGRIVQKYDKLDIPLEITDKNYQGHKLSELYPDIQNFSNIITYNLEGYEAGLITWDKKTVNAVAVDGQHRLFALKEFYETNQKFQDVLIPIISIMFEDFSEKTLTEYLREIFIDINKNSKPVSKARNIILDDRELSSVFTKQLFYSYTKSVEQNKNTLMPEILDWQSDNPKAEASFQLSSVIILHKIISEIYLENKELNNKNYFDPDAINKFVSLLNKKFGIDEFINKNEEGMPTLQEYAKDRIDSEQTFSLSKKHYEILSDIFDKTIKEKIYYVYNQFLPYNYFINCAKELKIFEKGNIANEYIRTPIKQRDDFVKVYNDEIGRGERTGAKFIAKEYYKPLEEMKEDNLVYNLIGQVAIFSSIESIPKLDENHDHIYFINALNYILKRIRIFDKAFQLPNKRYFWDYLATQQKGQKISATTVSINNISNIMKVLYFIYYIYVDKKLELSEVSAKKFHSGEIFIFNDANSPENTRIRNISQKVIERLKMANIALDDRLHDDYEQAIAVAEANLEKFINMIVDSLVKNR